MNLLSLIKPKKQSDIKIVPAEKPNVHEKIVKAESEAELIYQIKTLHLKGWIMLNKEKIYKQDGVYYTKLYKRLPRGI